MKSIHLIFCILLIIQVIPAKTFAQRFRSDNEFVDYRLATDKKQDNKSQNNLLNNKLKERALQMASEGPIDPQKYIVGPGDIFTISIGVGNVEDNIYNVQVAVDGTLFIPTLGALKVGAKSLQAVQELIRDQSMMKYDLSKIDFSFVLSQPRLIKVHVLGQVNQPGPYVGSAVDRVTSFVQQAQGFSDWAALNKIRIKHKDGTAETIDLSKIYNEADLSQDVLLRGGDAIFVPPVELAEGSIFVEGSSQIQGAHPFLQDESIKDFLYRIRAVDRATNLNQITLNRGAVLRRVDFEANPSEGHLNASTKLKPGDKIYLSYLNEYVYVHGAVRNPGYFPFFAGFKAMDYAGLAGGTEEMGSLNRIKVIDAHTGKSQKGAKSDVHRGDSVFVPLSYRSSLSKILEVAAQLSSILIAAKAVGIINPRN